MLYLTVNMIFLVLIEWAELFLYIDSTKKRAARRNAKTLTLSFLIYHGKSYYLDSNIQRQFEKIKSCNFLIYLV
jgi:hypothetical protein